MEADRDREHGDSVHPTRGLHQSKYAAFCVEALEKALAKHGAPKIFNTDQGSQFTSSGWIEVLTDAKVKIRMDGKSRWIDKRMIERL
jgi:putative transposase